MEYSSYTLEQIKSGMPNYDEVCKLLLNLSLDDDTKEKVESILYNGGYNGYNITSNITSKNNPFIEAQRRIGVAYLAVRNPETFDTLVTNNINLFHGTNGNALPTIIERGLCSIDELNKNNVNVSTGEQWSRINGERNFISFTDIVDIAEGYSTLKPQNGVKDLSFEVIIGTTVENINQAGRSTIRSDIPEVGVNSRLPIEGIKMIAVPSDKVEFVQTLLANTNIEVTAIDDCDNKFYYIDDFGPAYIEYDKYYDLRDKLILRKREQELKTTKTL